MSASASFAYLFDQLGMWWPEGDSDALHLAGDAWSETADIIEEASVVLNAVAERLIDNYEGEAADRFADQWKKWVIAETGYLPATVADCRKLAVSLHDFSTDVAIADHTLAQLVEQALQAAWFAPNPANPDRIPTEWIEWLQDAGFQLFELLRARTTCEIACDSGALHNSLDPGLTSDSARPQLFSNTRDASSRGSRALPAAPGDEPDLGSLVAANINWPDPGNPVDLRSLIDDVLDFGAGQGSVRANTRFVVALPTALPFVLPTELSAQPSTPAPQAPPAPSDAAATTTEPTTAPAATTTTATTTTATTTTVPSAPVDPPAPVAPPVAAPHEGASSVSPSATTNAPISASGESAPQTPVAPVPPIPVSVLGIATGLSAAVPTEAVRTPATASPAASPFFAAPTPRPLSPFASAATTTAATTTAAATSPATTTAAATSPATTLRAPTPVNNAAASSAGTDASTPLTNEQFDKAILDEFGITPPDKPKAAIATNSSLATTRIPLPERPQPVLGLPSTSMNNPLLTKPRISGDRVAVPTTTGPSGATVASAGLLGAAGAGAITAAKAKSSGNFPLVPLGGGAPTTGDEQNEPKRKLRRRHVAPPPIV